RARDVVGLGNVATVSIRVGPTADNDSFTVPIVSGQRRLIVAASGVLANDLDSKGLTPTSASLVKGPANGSISFSSNGSFIYTPNSALITAGGTDTFTYRSNDAFGNGNVATVTINVPKNRAPVAVNDSFNALLPSLNVLANDSDPDGDTKTA